MNGAWLNDDTALQSERSSVFGLLVGANATSIGLVRALFVLFSSVQKIVANTNCSNEGEKEVHVQKIHQPTKFKDEVKLEAQEGGEDAEAQLSPLKQ